MALAAMAEAGAEPSRTIFVGDTGWDMGCARGAGAGAIGAGWGYHEVAELEAGGAHAVAMAPGDVMTLADAWILGGVDD
jgi:phosphoglycolate phosphatase